MSSREVPLPSANDLTPDPALVARFRRDLEAIAAVPRPERRLGLAVSGGGDSVAMLLLAAAAYPGAVAAATVDHGLRAEAADEAAWVHELCGALGVPHAILTKPGWMTIDGSGQEWARALRYRLLDLWAAGETSGSGQIAWVACAHQQDDIAESLLMRARRGAGVGGMAAMAAARPLLEAAPDGRMLVRPLLGWMRAELAAVVTAARLAPVDDPSNRDPRYDRSRMRALLAATPELPMDRLARAASNLRDAEDALAWIAEREWTGRSRTDDRGALWLDAAGLPRELRRRLALRAIRLVRSARDAPLPIREAALERVLAALDSGGTAMTAGVQARAIDAKWRFRLAPPRRSH